MRGARLLSLALLLGCAVDPVEGRFPPQLRPALDAGGVEAGFNSDAAASELEDPSGAWMLFTQDRYCLVAVGDAIEALIWSYYVVEIAPTAPGRATLTQRARMCRQELSPLTLGFLSVVPDAVPDGAPDVEFEAFLDGVEPGGAYLTGTLAELWGAEGVGLDEPLPTTPDDPRLVDQDEDGAPAATFPVTTPTGHELCQVFVTQRMTHALRGEVIDGRRIEGEAEATLDKVVLDASSELCASGEMEPNAAPNTFTLARIDGAAGAPDLDRDGDGRVDCGELRDQLEAVKARYGIAHDAPDADRWCAP